MFDVQRSSLINPSYETSQGQSFLFDQSGRSRPEEALKPETLFPMNQVVSL
jgi:hypothetical protein